MSERLKKKKTERFFIRTSVNEKTMTRIFEICEKNQWSLYGFLRESIKAFIKQEDSIDDMCNSLAGEKAIKGGNDE